MPPSPSWSLSPPLTLASLLTLPNLALLIQTPQAYFWHCHVFVALAILGWVSNPTSFLWSSWNLLLIFWSVHFNGGSVEKSYIFFFKKKKKKKLLILWWGREWWWCCLKLKPRRDPSSWFFILKILGRASQFTRVRSQGARNWPKKPNIKINWPTPDPYRHSDLSVGLRVKLGRTGGPGQAKRVDGQPYPWHQVCY